LELTGSTARAYCRARSAIFARDAFAAHVRAFESLKFSGLALLALPAFGGTTAHTHRTGRAPIVADFA
jgi:hypothetical protein